MFFNFWKRHPRIIVYTAIFGPYDDLHDPEVICPHCEYICFTDQPFTSSFWKIISVDTHNQDVQRMARRHKILAHNTLPPCDYSLWIDGQNTLTVTPDVLIKKFLGEHDMALFAHPDRNCIYDEAEVCTHLKLDDAEAIKNHMETYRAQGYPRYAGLADTRFLLRKHTPTTEKFNEAWWQEIIRHNSRRDQLSFNKVCWELGMRYGIVEGDCAANAYVHSNGHRVKRSI